MRFVLRSLLVLILVGPFAWWYATGLDVRVFALSETDGRRRWAAGFAWDTDAVGVPVVGDGRVVVASARDRGSLNGRAEWRISAFDADTGRQLWQAAPHPDGLGDLHALDMLLAAPLVTPDRVYARAEGSEAAALRALDAATGEPVWSYRPIAAAHRSGYTDVTVSIGRVAVPSPEGEGLAIQALDARDGTPLWRTDLGLANFTRIDLGPFLAADDATVFVGLNTAVVALDAATGTERFRVAEPAEESGGEIWLDGPTLYRRTGLRTIAAYDAATGTPRWAYTHGFGDRGGALRSFRASGDDLLTFCACETPERQGRGWLIAVDARDGRERWRAGLDAYIELYQDAPALGRRTALLGSEREDVVARSLTDGAELWPVERRVGRSVAAEGGLVYATDRTPRWHFWLATLTSLV